MTIKVRHKEDTQDFMPDFSGLMWCIPTGKLNPDDSTMIGIEMPYNQSMYAQQLFPVFAMQTITEKWLSANKNNILVGVIFEYGKKRLPVVVGFKPVDATQPLKLWEPYPEGYARITENFRIIIDDKNEYLSLETIDKSLQVVIDAKNNKILSGNTSATQHAVFGDALKTWLNNLVTTLQTATTATAIGPMPFLPDTQLALAQAITDLDTILSSTNLLT